MAKRLNWEKENRIKALNRMIAQASHSREYVFDFSSGPSTSRGKLENKQDAPQQSRKRRQNGAKDLSEKRYISKIRQRSFAGPGHSKHTKHLLTAAEQGDVRAQFILAREFILGHKYGNGDGPPRDLVKAFAWLHLASKQGYPKAAAIRDLLAKVLTPPALLKAQALSKKYLAAYVMPPSETAP